MTAETENRLLIVDLRAHPAGEPRASRYRPIRAYQASGYGSTIEEVAASTGKVITRSRTPYGSFELAAADGYVTTASLLNGELAIYTPKLRLLRTRKLAPATRDVEIAYP